MPANQISQMPVALFTSVMGLAGLTLCWMRASQEAHWIAPEVVLVLQVISTIVFVALFVGFILKTILFTERVKLEVKNPDALSFFSTIPIGMVLIATLWAPTLPLISHILWMLGAAGMLIVTLAIFNSWLSHSHYNVTHLCPPWFIPVVGNVLIPFAGVHFGYVQMSWFFFSIGLIFWIMMMAMMLNRLFFLEPLPTRLRPTLYILIAPPALIFIAYLALNDRQVDTFARILYNTALFVTMLLAINTPQFLRVPFSLAGWAYSFPLAALTVASFEMALYTQSSVYFGISWFLLWVVTAIVGFLFFKTIAALLARTLYTLESATER